VSEAAPATGGTSADAGSPRDAGPGDSAADAESRSQSSEGGMCTLSGGDTRGFGAPCDDVTNHSDCPCAADYCSKSPFDARGYCSVTGCKENPNICPPGWSCFDVSLVAPGQPSVCTRP